MPLDKIQKLQILKSYPTAQAVYTLDRDGDETIVVVLPHEQQPDHVNVPDTLAGLPVDIEFDSEFTDLRFYPNRPGNPLADPNTAQHRSCHDEPIPGGVQIQPRTARWVGTLGTACSFLDGDRKRQWGLLSNWHVLCAGAFKRRHPLCQPDTTNPVIAHLDDWHPVDSSLTNYIDAAVADSRIDGLHSVGPAILGASRVHPIPVHAELNLPVMKSGRTTGITEGLCVGVAAAVKINYGTFVAAFVDQDLFEGTDQNFSAAGDSGSLIFTDPGSQPVSLLFAGGGRLTIGNPIRRVIQRFNLRFNFP